LVERLVSLILAAAREVAAREGVALPPDLGADTPLFGERGLFDSLGLVSLVVTVEEGIEDQLGVALILADERAMSQARSPFRSVRSLAEYAERLIEASGADRR
jgi:acyl carrier protein